MNVLLWIATIVGSIVLGLAVGLSLDDVPVFSLSKPMGVQDVASILLSTMALFFVPFMLNKWIDNKKHIKQMVVEEFRDYLSKLSDIKRRIKECYLRGDNSLTQQDKKEIIEDIKDLENHLHSCTKQLTHNYGRKKADGIKNSLIQSHSEYWHEVTNDLMTDGQRVDQSYKSRTDQAFVKHSEEIKLSIYEITDF